MATPPVPPLVDAPRCSQSDADFWAVLLCEEVPDPVSASSLVHGASRIATAKATDNLRKPSNINSHSLSVLFRLGDRLWNEYRAALDGAIAQIVQRRVGLIQAIFPSGKCHESAVGERHQFDEVGIGADQISDNGFFGDDHIHRWNFDFATVSDNIIAAGIPRHLQALSDGIAFTDKVDYRFGASAFRQRKDGL